jgi:hypothetical protein
MYEKIKTLADEAIALQNKTRMDAVLREISGICYMESMKTLFQDKREQGSDYVEPTPPAEAAPAVKKGAKK